MVGKGTGATGTDQVGGERGTSLTGYVSAKRHGEGEQTAPEIEETICGGGSPQMLRC